MKSEFKMRMIGELNFFLGIIQVKETIDAVFISQSKYVRDLVKKFKRERKTHARTPISTTLKISTPIGKSIDPTWYKSAIGSLLDITTSRLDISLDMLYFKQTLRNHTSL